MIAGNDIKVANFDALQAFGGGRKGGSDHCPLWIELKQGEAREREVERNKEKEGEILRRNLEK